MRKAITSYQAMALRLHETINSYQLMALYLDETITEYEFVAWDKLEVYL